MHSRKSPTHFMRQQQPWRTSTHDEAATRDRPSRSQNMEQTLKQTCSQEYPESAACVQDPIDSLNSAIRNAHRTSLRPSSTFEPRHPSLKGVIGIENSEGRGPRERQKRADVSKTKSECVVAMAEQDVSSTPTATFATLELTPRGQRYNLHP